ncbi:uncharacterized protein LOC111251101 isoform X1 [Varroa destructor]|uniref:Major facilitator superfamily (MFS) profile domain-containing protein n=1 Tax=Varroa destructor TaxID=109461 RepID=A0A7M7K8D2_VARDE|nr:uncharacterized protein LOC111251101 isoform X1 [Varroa destructor]XP_022663130.1 uncharacterized protein LOC111251101 isoform X1 [Varroa destructor]XP_022663131.1 uncharacterized protein LOC111251101 isoform X1 [Varroa destructor]XP_022663132.1 uncharacterized protein LOC111251101 isoform X1 [Varroa destructor]XP_022663133.1 uncharacterized protein LOC111251101 isoform X1 [Varroa destructor]XP_022663134.1 uncharacterized protein LOC111251101 isoform X1 [Varroa destructor]
MPAALSTHPPLTDRDDSDEGSACNTRLSGITYNLTSPASLSSSGSDPGQWLTPPAASPFTHSSRTSNWSFEDEPSWCSACLAGVGRWVIGKLAEDISRSEAWLLATITGVNFLSFCAGSIIAPILPQHLAKKMEQFGKEGTVSELHVSLAFVLYAGSSMISSLVFGPFIPRFGVEYLYYPGLITVALTNIALGALDLLPIGSYENYILAQRVIRVIEGIGAAAFNTSSHSIIMKVFSRYIDEAFAAVEAAVAISFSLGPIIGSLLVSSFGWFWAFFVFGIIVLATIPISVCVFGNYGSLRYVEYLRIRGDPLLPLEIVLSWKGLFVVITMIITTTAFSFVEPTLELFLENTIQTEHSTAYYFAEATSFALTALAVAPFIAARSKMGTMILGTSILGISFLLMGPCRYILRKPNDVATMFGVIVLGIGFALAYVPTLDFLVDTAIYDLGYFKHPATYGPISGLWNFLNGFGETFGPVIAMFQNSPDIRDATLVFSTVLFTCGIGLTLIFFHLSVEKTLEGHRLAEGRKVGKTAAFASRKSRTLADKSKLNNSSNDDNMDNESHTESGELANAIKYFLKPSKKDKHVYEPPFIQRHINNV